MRACRMQLNCDYWLQDRPAGDYSLLGVTSVFRRGQVAQASDSPAVPVTSGPPQEPRKQRPLKTTPTAMIAMTIAMPPRVSRNSAISHEF